MENLKKRIENHKKEGEKMQGNKMSSPVVYVFYGENNLADCMRDILKLHMETD